MNTMLLEKTIVHAYLVPGGATLRKEDAEWVVVSTRLEMVGHQAVRGAVQQGSIIGQP